MQPLEGYQLEAEAGTRSRWSSTSTTSCAARALAREIVHAVQNARKGAGLEVEDRIELTLGGDDELLDAVRAHEDYVAGETLAANLAFDGAQPAGTHTETASIDGSRLGIALRRAG